MVDGKGKGEVQAKEEQAAESVAVVWWRWQRRRREQGDGLDISHVTRRNINLPWCTKFDWMLVEGVVVVRRRRRGGGDLRMEILASDTRTVTRSFEGAILTRFCVATLSTS
ncbi:hypothetical protein N9995_00010 [bacterium]|nr:hypothetical protein [bacterium]